MTTVLDKEILKEALRELFQEEPNTFKSMLKDVLFEAKITSDSKFDELLKRNFKRFDETFRALA